MAKRKTQYEKGIDRGYLSGANAALHFIASADKQHVQNLAESLAVTHKDMLEIEDAVDLDFEEYIQEYSSYWK